MPASNSTAASTIDLHRIAVDTMRTRGLLPEFSPEALQEADQARFADDGRGDVRDLRALPWFSIDNDDTQDLDQLSVAEALPAGEARLRVAIADVDARVRPAGAVDSHAAANTTSVYTAAGVFPMLPETLSTDATSLHEGQERLAVVVDMRVLADGTVAGWELYRANVLNRAKLTYDAVSAWLDGAGEPPTSATQIQDQVRLHDAIATRLRQWRHRRGALNVKTVSPRPVFEDGRLVDLRADEKNRAKDLIADLMIATNAATARFLAASGMASMRRVLDAPRRWDRIVALAAQHGAALPGEPDPVALDRFLGERRAAAPEAFEELSLSIVKLLGSGQYAVVTPGAPPRAHFGLAVNDYAHSTAPNRRFTDLVTQRQVKAILRGEADPYGEERLNDIARHCTLQEDNANKVERDVMKAAAALLLRDRVGEIFHAVVTGVKPNGTFVRITRPLIEGRLVRGQQGADVGDCLQVRLVSVDPGQSYIDFALA